MKKLISNLPELRRRYGNATLRQVSEKTGIAVSTLSKIETGKTKGAEFETIEKLCDLFKVEPGELFRLVDPDEYHRTFKQLVAA